MLPEKRPTLFSVTGVARLVNGGLLQQEIVVALVRVVTVAACHFAKAQWMVAGAERIGLPVGMTGEARVLLGKRVEDTVDFEMNLVTGGAGNVFSFVSAAEPAQATM